MANLIRLETYTIRFKKLRIKDEYLELDSIFINSDFTTFFSEYVNSIEGTISLDESKKLSLQFQANSLTLATEKRMISGFFESGEYGYGGRIVDTETGNETYKKKTSDTDTKPFYFLLFIPNDSTKGILVLQRFGIHGIHTIFKQNFANFVRQKNPDLMTEISPLVAQEVLKKFLDFGDISQVTLRRHNLPKDSFEKYSGIGQTENIKSMEFILKSKSGSFFSINNEVKKYIADPNTHFFDIPPLRDIGFDGNHSVTIKVDLNGTVRNIDLSDSGNIRPYIDIDNEVEKDESNHPKFDSIDTIAKKLVEDLYSKSYE